MKHKAKAPKPRNPFVTHAMFHKGAGVHDKPHKVKRAANKAAIKKQVRDSFDPDYKHTA